MFRISLVFIVCSLFAALAYANDCERELIGMDRAALRAYKMYSETGTGFLAMSNPTIENSTKSCGHTCLVNLIQMLRLSSGQEVLASPADLVNEINSNPEFRSGLGTNGMADIAQKFIAAHVDRSVEFKVSAIPAIQARQSENTQIVSGFKFEDLTVDETTGKILVFIAFSPEGEVRGAHTLNVLRRVQHVLMVSDPNFPQHIFQYEMINAIRADQPVIILHPREDALVDIYGTDATYVLMAVGTAKLK